MQRKYRLRVSQIDGKVLVFAVVVELEVVIIEEVIVVITAAAVVVVAK